MANVIDRKTGRYIESVNTPDFPAADFIINPDMTAVKNVSPEFWKIDGDQVREMDAAEKAIAIDAKPKPATCPINGKPCYYLER